MKLKNIAIAFFVLATFTYAGCNKIKDALDVTFETTFSSPMNFNVLGSSRDINEGGIFNESVTVDMTTATQFNDYKEKLKSATTKAVTFTVTSTSVESVNLSNMFLTISYDGQGIIGYPLPDMIISNGDSFTVPEDQLNLLNDLILLAQGLTIEVSGSTDVAPVQFSWTVTIDAEIVANPLD